MINLIHQYVQIWNSKEIDKLATIFSKAAIYKDILQNGNSIEILSASINETHKAFPNISFEIISIIEDKEGEDLLLEWSMKGTNTGSFFGAEPTSKDIEIFGADVIKIKDKKIISIKSYYDSSQFTTQLGV